MTSENILVLKEALPYVKKFMGKTFVIKYGGSILDNKEAQEIFIEDVAFLRQVGINVVIVHGGGPHISKLLGKLGIETKFVNGLRVTDEKVIEVVEMVLSGHINKSIASTLCKNGINAVGISGRDNNLIEAEKKYVEDGDEKIDIGYVGKVVSVNAKLLKDLIDNEYVPVISPVGCDKEGNAYNINADYTASAISSALNAEKLILLTDVPGIYMDINDPNSLISSITIDEIKKYINDGIIKGGMIPKMECCIEAIENGTKSVHIIDGKNEHSLLLEIFTNKGIGTMIEGGR